MFFKQTELTALIVRHANVDECNQIIFLMKKLAQFEGYINAFNVTEDDLKKRCFKMNDFAILVTEIDNRLEGILVYYYLPFIYDLKPWMCIKALYINDDYRGLGLGKQLMTEAAKVSVHKGANKMCWQVLASNDAAQDFYPRLGASKEAVWENFNLQGDALKALGESL